MVEMRKAIIPVWAVITGIITIIIFLEVMGGTSGTLLGADNNITAANNTMPLGGLFSSTGVLALVLMASIFIFLITIMFIKTSPENFLKK